MKAHLAAATVLATIIGLSGAIDVLAQEPRATFDWTATPPLSGVVVDGAARVVSTSAGGVFPLSAINVSNLGSNGYEIRGNVRYMDVTGSGYVEMWSVFPDGSRYFSRTLAADGPMAALSGSSDWRPLELPFLPGAAVPNRIEINVVLPGAGSVDIGTLELVVLPAGGGDNGAWFSDRVVGIAGAIGGSVIGLFGALIGVLVSRRRGRDLVLRAMIAAAASGAVLIVVAGVALVVGQPTAVVYLLLLSGAILVLAFGLTLPRVRRHYVEAELRRMRAIDQP